MKRNTNEHLVKIAVNKSLLKEFFNDSQRTVYMDTGSEFQIQIFNPYSYVIGATISINGTLMSNMLVIKPGQRIWLERYLNEARKFLFETYEVNDSKPVRDAIANNGVIEVKLYKEKQEEPIKFTFSPNNYRTVYYDGYNDYASNITHALYCATDAALTASASVKSYSDTVASTKSFSKGIETGRIEKGSHSDQKFKTVYNDFEYFPFKTETIHILPTSRKPIYANELKKIYCTNCGRKLNTKYKFCPYCGTKCVF